MNKCDLKVGELFSDVPSLLQKYFDKNGFAWEILPRIKDIIEDLTKTPPDGYTKIEDGVYVGKNVKIAKTATIEKPAIIGNDVEIRPGAYLRGNVIVCDGCTVGNSSELKNCILMVHAQVPHYNYVGDSVLGNYAHMGAGSICSNLKSDGKPVVVHADTDYPTGLRKFGAILGDRADIGCGCVLNPGTVIGQNTNVYPLTMLRGAYPKDSIVKSTREIVQKI